jgi:tripartite-type tricarboxylate transporter receptor subunit TctC
MRLLLVFALLALAAPLLPSAHAQSYPTKPIRLVVPFTPGGGVDINARLVAQKLTEYLGQQVIVESRPGAGTNIGNEFVAKSVPDGYTLLINAGSVAINMSLYTNLNYDALRDFVAISIFSESPNVLVVSPFAAGEDCEGSRSTRKG